MNKTYLHKSDRKKGNYLKKRQNVDGSSVG